MDFLYIYPIIIWFFFYIWNHSDILSNFRTFIYNKLNVQIVYLLQCSFCTTFWISGALFIIGLIPALFIVTAPVINLFIELSFKNLSLRKEVSNHVIDSSKPKMDTTTHNKDVFIITETSGDIQTK
jgi:hypothetical protein